MGHIGKRIAKLDNNMKKGFAILYDQCSDAVKTRLETVDGWDRIDCDQSVYDLVKAIQKICVGHDDTNQDMYNVVQACKNMFLFRQSDEALTKDYLRDFKSYWDTCEMYKAEPVSYPKLVQARLDEIAVNIALPSADEKSKTELEIKDEFMAGLVISSANQKRFGILKRDLQNAYLKGQDDYPKTFEEANRLLSNWKAPQTSAFVRPPARSGGVAFIQSGGKAESNPKDKAGKPAPAPEKKTNSKGESHCYNCGESGHWSS